MQEESPSAITELTARIVAAYVSSNSLAAGDLTGLIHSVHGALNTLGAPAQAPVEPQKPAVAIRKSITDEYLISLEDGARYKSLKRHLKSKYNLTPDEYRAKWGLPKDYPMVAPAYAAARSALAKQIGLGQSRREPSKKAAPRKRAPKVVA